MRAAELDRIIPGGAIRHRKEWRDARCPAHEDTRPSFSYRDDEARGRIVLHCRRGCPPEAIARALGLPLSAFSFEETPMHEVEYLYRDREGTVLYVVERR